MKYFIAYKDEYGKDFNGFPWIIPEGGFDDLKIALNVKFDFINRKFKDVKIFKCNKISEEIDWNFVIENEINEYEE